MCGRYTHRFTWAQLRRLMRLTTAPEGELLPRYNVAPTQGAPVVRAGAGGDGGEREGVVLRWGLVPHWAEDPSIGGRMINARAETAAEKPAFRDAVKRRRCLVPMSGFYEWRAGPGGKAPKQPFYIRPAQGEIFAVAGLWARWEKGGDAPLETFALLTTAANELMRPIHDRMPVILAERDWDRWLDPGVREAAAVADLLAPAPAEWMAAHPVSRLVNSPANDRPECIEPLAAAPPEEGEPGLGW